MGIFGKPAVAAKTLTPGEQKNQDLACVVFGVTISGVEYLHTSPSTERERGAAETSTVTEYDTRYPKALEWVEFARYVTRRSTLSSPNIKPS